MTWGVSEYLSLAALVLSILIPILRFIYIKLIVKPKICILPFGDVYLLYDSYGSYMQLSFTVSCERCDVTILSIDLDATRDDNKQKLHMEWGYMLPIDARFVDRNTRGKRAHPVKLRKDSIEPFSIEFYTKNSYGYDLHRQLEAYRRKTPSNSSPHKKPDDKRKSIEKLFKKHFFWKAGMYDIAGKLLYSNNHEYTFRFRIRVLDAEEKQLAGNAEKIIDGEGGYSMARVVMQEWTDK